MFWSPERIFLSNSLSPPQKLSLFPTNPTLVAGLKSEDAIVVPLTESADIEIGELVWRLTIPIRIKETPHLPYT